MQLNSRSHMGSVQSEQGTLFRLLSVTPLCLN